MQNGKDLENFSEKILNLINDNYDVFQEKNNLDSIKQSFEKIFDFFTIKLPEMIYYYTNVSTLKKIIDNKEFWVTKCNFLNDNAELTYLWYRIFPSISLTDKNFKLLLTTIIDKINIKSKDFFIDDLTDEYYILSFSKNKDNFLLWSNYASHEGYNIGFNPIDLFNSIDGKQQKNNLSVKLYGNVIYDEKIQVSILEKVLNDSSIDFNNSNSIKAKEQIILITIEKLRILSLFFKGELFKNEDEFRFIFAMDKNKNNACYRENDTSIIPYIHIEFNIDTNYNKKIIEVITIGPKNKIDISKKGLFHYLQSKKLENETKIVESGITLRY